MPSPTHWEATWTALGARDLPALRGTYEDLVARYSEPHRKYHTLRHLEDCLATFAEVRALAERPAEVEVALWFHDAVYDTRSDQNEARSAELAAETVIGTGQPPGCAHRIETLVMATRHDATPTDTDAKVLADVDLSILGADPRRFDEYERQVREEYGWMPGPLYRSGRRKILQAFMTRPVIFSTPHMRARHEARARANIARSLEAL